MRGERGRWARGKHGKGFYKVLRNVHRDGEDLVLVRSMQTGREYVMHPSSLVFLFEKPRDRR
jgi:hypothetical protein